MEALGHLEWSNGSETFVCEFGSRWVPHSCGRVKKLSKKCYVNYCISRCSCFDGQCRKKMNMVVRILDKRCLHFTS